MSSIAPGGARARSFLVGAGLCLIALTAATPASALVIDNTFRSDGEDFDFDDGQSFNVGSAEAPGNVSGGASLSGLMRDASDYWEGIIADTGTLNIEFGWQSLSGSTLAVATQFEDRDFTQPGGKPGLIRFDNDIDTEWFGDTTPLNASEYGSFTETTEDLGGGPMTTGREYNNGSGAASGFDLFTVALHEIGHLLGVADFGTTAFTSGTIVIGSGPFAGADIPLTTAGGGHIDKPDTLMRASISSAQRRLASDADIAVAAELSGFTDVNFAAATAHVPLPGTMVLILSALGLLGLSRAAA